MNIVATDPPCWIYSFSLETRRYSLLSNPSEEDVVTKNILYAMEGGNVEEDEDNEEVATVWELLICFYEEIKDSTKFFNLNDFAEGILLKFCLPANDIVSDFWVAQNLSRIRFKKDNISNWFTFFAYYFIAFPGFMFFFTNIGKFTDRFCKRCCRCSLIPFLSMVCFFCLEALLVIYSPANLLFPVAVLVASVILVIGIMGVFFHGPYMKKISFLVAGYEGRYESAPQFMMHLVFLISGEQYFSTSGLNTYGLITSLAMLGKDLAENILTNGQNHSFLGLSFISKIVLMRRIILVIILTAIFRLGTVALAIHHIFVLDCGLLLVPLKLIIIVPPVIGILFVQKCSSQTHLSVTECFVGIVGELSAFHSWSGLNTELRRSIQLGLNMFFGILYGTYCVWTVFNPPSLNADNFAILFLCCAWVAFPLYLSHIYFNDSVNSVFQGNEVIEEEQEQNHVPEMRYQLSSNYLSTV